MKFFFRKKSNNLYTFDFMNFKTSAKRILLTFFMFLPVFCTSRTEYSRDDSLKAVQFHREAMEFALKGEPEKALEFFKKSLEYRKRVFGENHYRLGSTYMGMAIQYKNLLQYDNAHQYFLLAEKMYLYNAPENDSRLGDIYTNIGNYYRQKGNLSEAIRYHERAVYIYEHSPDKFNRENYVSAIYNLANCYHQINMDEKALQLATQHLPTGPVSQQIQYMRLIASIFTFTGQPGKAKTMHHEMIRLILKENGREDLSLADQYLIYAQLLNVMSEHDSALNYLGKAEKIYRLYRNTRGEIGEVYNATGKAYASKMIESSSFEHFQMLKRENLLNALSWYKKGLEVINPPGESIMPGADVNFRSNFPALTLQLLQNSGICCQQLAGLASAQAHGEKTEFLSEALNYYSAASDMVGYLRTGFVTEESKSLISELEQDIFVCAIESAYELHEITGNIRWAEVAFHHSEKNKAVTLYDQITEIESRSGQLIADSLIRMESTCNSNLAYYREKLYEENMQEKPDSARLASLNERIFNNEQQLVRIRESMEANYSGYYQMKYKVRPLTFDAVKKRLRKDEVLLSYTLNPGRGSTEGEIYIIALSKKDYHFVRQPFHPKYSEQVLQIYDFVSSTGFLLTGIEDFRTYCEAANDLYTILFKPCEDFIKGKKITIVPGGILSYLPFEALLDEKPDLSMIHFHDLPYLIKRYTINYAYSAVLLHDVTNGLRLKKKKTIAFAPSYDDDDLFPHLSVYLPGIPGSVDEVTFLKRRLNATTFMGKASTEKKFREEAGKYQIVHLAMHALINDSLPLFSRLLFSPEIPDSLDNDGLLNTADIYNLKMGADMTVLSACNTGGGIFRTGEGVISLARGFMYAGCHSVVLSLWNVEDQSGSEIMKDFYRNLLFGKSKDAALRTAKLHYLQHAGPATAHPHLWLGYISIGQSDPLFSGLKNHLLVLMGGILIFLISDLAVRKVRGRKKGMPPA